MYKIMDIPDGELMFEVRFEFLYYLVFLLLRKLFTTAQIIESNAEF